MLRKIKAVFFTYFQYLIPQHLLSRAVGKLAQSQNQFLKNFLIRLAISHFKINLADAVIQDPQKFKSFNDFFTRHLKPYTRPFPNNSQIIASPADGCISQIGKITEGKIIQAKKHNFSVLDLLGGHQEQANFYQQGFFTTIYLAPKDYHRVHMPTDGQLVSYTYIPGKLFSVNQTTAENIPNLFARNERVCFFFESSHGPFVVIMVGAMLVASIGTVFEGVLPLSSTIRTQTFPTPRLFKQGEELGFFQFGSTVILLFPKSRALSTFQSKSGDKILCGESLVS